MTDQGIHAILRSERQALTRRLLLTAFGQAVGVALFPLLLITVADRFMVLREPVAFGLALALGVTGVIFVLFRLASALRRIPTEQQVVLLLEKNCPQLMDSLACLQEELASPERRSALHEVLLARVSEMLNALDLRQEVMRDATPMGRVLAVYVLTAAMIIGVAVQPFAGKALAHGQSLADKDASGLLVLPGNAESAIGGDVAISAEILRGAREATVEIRSARGEHSYAMYEAEEAKLAYDVFAVDSDFSYRVSTPTLRSAWYAISTYERPGIRQVTVRVTPPAYTKLPAREQLSLDDLQAPEGSEIEVNFVFTLPVALELVPVEGDALTVGETLAATGRYAAVLEETMDYGIVMTDAAGHREQAGRRLRIEAVPDLPPAVHVVAPEDDAHVHVESEVTFALSGIDDYGITAMTIFYAINDDDFQPHPVYFAKDGETLEKSRTDSAVFELDGLVVEGDVISYYGVASDNAEPENQTGETDVRFLEIRPLEDESISTQMSGGSGSKSEDLNISDLIVEQKHLIRATWGALRRIERPETKAELERVTRDAEQLATAAAKRWEELKERAGEALGGPIPELFEEALTSMQNASVALESALPRESMKFQQDSLAKLIQIEIELLKNSMQAEGQGGEGGEPPKEPPENAQAQESEGDEKSAQKQKERVADLKAFLNRLEMLIHKQENIISEISRNLRKPITPAARDHLANEQHANEQDCEVLRAELRQFEEAYPVASELQNASANMGEAKRRLRSGATGASHVLAKRGHHFLERAYERLSQLIDAYEADQFTKAQRQLDRLVKKQEELKRDTETAAKQKQDQKKAEAAKKSEPKLARNDEKQPSPGQSGKPQQPGEAGKACATGKPGQTGAPSQQAGGPGAGGQSGGKDGQPPLDSAPKSGQPSADETAQASKTGTSSAELKKRQEELRDELNKFMSQLSSMAGDYESTNPGLSNGISEAASNARKDKVDASMKRAENALRYKKEERAADFQEKALAGMAGLSKGLEKAAAAGGGASQEQLSEMLEEVLDDLTKAQDKQSEAGGEEGQAGGEEGQAGGEEGQAGGEEGQAGKSGKDGKGEGEKAKGEEGTAGQGHGAGAGMSSGDPNQGAGSLRDRVTSSLATMGSKLSDPEMASIAKGVAQLRADGDPRLVAYLAQAAQILEEHLAAGAMQNRIELSRLPGSRPPDAYRKLVNQYFKQLSERASARSQ